MGVGKRRPYVVQALWDGLRTKTTVDWVGNAGHSVDF